ncbi:MAG: WGR domain-containing protein [Acidobacteriota bacterium]
MKLIKQTKLVFQEGRSDKVYEVDLCEVSANGFVVNFRYGRRGTNLKEGTKTETAVSLIEAQKVFDNLVAEKLRKGYKDADAPSGTLASPQPVDVWGAKKSAATNPEEARKQAVLHRLQQGDALKKPEKKKKAVSNIFSQNPKPQNHFWSLERAIWRAGELKIREAAPYLVQLLGTGDALRDYCIAWSLGFCGDEQTIAPLSQLYQNRTKPEMVRRIACEALLKLSDDATKAAFRNQLINQLPSELSYLARQGTPETFEKVLNEYLETDDQSHFQVLETIYLLDNEIARPALLNLLRTAPLKPNYFKALRHIFKAAEYRRDAEVFGLLAYRFEKARANFSTWTALDKPSRYATWVYVGDARNYRAEDHIQNAREEIQKPASRIAYSTRTRIYLRKRVWRTLRRLGQPGDLDYVKMAVGVLLAYSDADAVSVRESTIFDPSKPDLVKTYWDAFAGYWAFNHILYTNSPRYYLRRNSKAWRCKSAYKPGDAAPKTREEAYPHLWEKRPEGLLHLIAESNCSPVLEFATRALNSCKTFCDELDIETILMILARPYECTAKLGFALAQKHYNPGAPHRDLLLALANCALEEARLQACRWANDARDRLIHDNEFIAALVFSPHADTRNFAKQLVRSVTFSEANAKSLVEKLINGLRNLEASQTDEARDIADTILKGFPVQLRALSMPLILQLLAHPLLEVQELGGNILLAHQTPAAHLPEAIINSLINSSFETLRGIGIKLFGQIDELNLFERDSVIANFAMHELEDIRKSIRPIIHKLCYPPMPPDSRHEILPIEPVDDPLTAEQRKTFSLKLADRFLKALFEKEVHAGVHSMLVKIMREDLAGHWLAVSTTGSAWKLIHAESQAAQELGGVLLEYLADCDFTVAQDMDFSDLVELSNHQVLAVRQSSWLLFAKMLHRLQHQMNPQNHLDEMAKAVKLLDAEWDDSRDFWFKMFDTYFTAEEFTAGILINVCDSVRPAVQAFGRKLITRFFAEADGVEYLLKLSEHPSADLQTFATNYLEGYAANHPERLNEMRHYFLSVLSRVNKARVAKNRILNFLTNEAQKSETAARIVAEILARQSVTMAIGDKAATLEAMLKIHRAFPQIQLPIEVKQPEVRHAF